KARPPYGSTHLRSPPLVACWPSPCVLTPGTEHKIPGEQQADIPLEVGQQHPDSHGGTNGKSKNNANKGEASILWSLPNDTGRQLLCPVGHHRHGGASRTISVIYRHTDILRLTSDHGPAALASVAYRDSSLYPLHQCAPPPDRRRQSQWARRPAHLASHP